MSFNQTECVVGGARDAPVSGRFADDDGVLGADKRHVQTAVLRKVLRGDVNKV